MKKAFLFLAVAFVFATTFVSCTTDELENEKTAKVKPQGESNKINPSTGNPPPRG